MASSTEAPGSRLFIAKLLRWTTILILAGAGVFLVVYSVAMLSGAAYFGRGWVRSSDGFAVLFAKLSAMRHRHAAVSDQRRRQLSEDHVLRELLRPDRDLHGGS